MEINAVLTTLLYFVTIVLVIVFIVVGIKLIEILNKIDDIADNVEEKINSFDGAITTLSKVSDGFANIANSLLFNVSSILAKVFHKKDDKEDF